MPQDEGYFFAYDSSDLKIPNHTHYSELRNSITSPYTPIYSNAYGYLHDKVPHKTADQIYRSLRVLSLDEFSRLCQWAHRSIEFSSILLLIIEACSSSLLVMPTGLSVALEGLTNLISKDNEEALAPIGDKQKVRKVRAELAVIISANAEGISDDGLKILKSRVENINQLTNKAKLTKPFELLKFRLEDEDKKAIEHRNDFLHGRFTLTPDKDLQETNNQIYYVALRLYTLVSVLVLKSIGYDNKIVNYPMIHNSIFKKKLDEDYFRQV